MLSDSTSIIIAFMATVLVFWMKVRTKIAASLDTEIATRRAKIDEAISLRIECERRLNKLQQDHQNIVLEVEKTINKAHADADTIIENAKKHVDYIQNKSLEAFKEFQRIEDDKLLSSFRSEVMITVLSSIQKMIEDMPDSKQMQLLGDSLRIVRKHWN